MVTPSIRMNPNMLLNSMGLPLSSITAMVQLVNVMVLPDRWIVAQRGITKSAIPAATPFFFVEAKVTGIVAAEDWVPIAVM